MIRRSLGRRSVTFLPVGQQTSALTNGVVGGTFVSSSPRHAGGSREVFDGGLPYHGGFFVSYPPATVAVRGRFSTVVCLIMVSAFPSRVIPR